MSASNDFQPLTQASNLENKGTAPIQVSPNDNDAAIMSTHCLSESSPTPSITFSSISDNLSSSQPISS